VAWAVWFTGLPGSGKTTVATEAEKRLAAQGIRVRRLEMDQVRSVLTPQPTYSEEERKIVYAAIAFMAKLLTEEGVNVIIDATGNLRQYRTLAMWLIPHFAEVYIECPMELSMEREARRKGGFAPGHIYEKGQTGRSHTVPGLNVPYEAPQEPLITIDTSSTLPEEAGKLAAAAIVKKFGGPAHG
jgi:adenylylsulfate kinase